jgi:hypothetical protein
MASATTGGMCSTSSTLRERVGLRELELGELRVLCKLLGNRHNPQPFEVHSKLASS